MNSFACQKNVSDLVPITKGYEESGLPGCCDSMDVVHMQWSQCPTSDLNRAKGKESLPTLAFECVTDFNRQILGVYGPHFGSRNDKEIVKSNPTVLEVTLGWLSQVFGSTIRQAGLFVCCKVCISFATMDICAGQRQFVPIHKYYKGVQKDTSHQI
jgi:hypothetical protein